MENTQEGSLYHERRDDPQRGAHVETAVAGQHVLVIAKLHREDFFADILQVDRRVLQLQNLDRHGNIVVQAERLVYLCKGSLAITPKRTAFTFPITPCSL